MTIYKCTYVFETNSSVANSDSILKEWVEKQDHLTDELTEKYMNEIASILFRIIEAETSSEIGKIEKKIEVLKNTILELISKISSASRTPNIMLARLLSVIYEKSSSTDINERCLDNVLLLKVINETNNEMIKNTNNFIIGLLDTRFDGIENNKEILVNSNLHHYEKLMLDEMKCVVKRISFEEFKKTHHQKKIFFKFILENYKDVIPVDLMDKHKFYEYCLKNETKIKFYESDLEYFLYCYFQKSLKGKVESEFCRYLTQVIIARGQRE